MQRRKLVVVCIAVVSIVALLSLGIATLRRSPTPAQTQEPPSTEPNQIALAESTWAVAWETPSSLRVSRNVLFTDQPRNRQNTPPATDSIEMNISNDEFTLWQRLIQSFVSTSVSLSTNLSPSPTALEESGPQGLLIDPTDNSNTPVEAIIVERRNEGPDRPPQDTSFPQLYGTSGTLPMSVSRTSPGPLMSRESSGIEMAGSAGGRSSDINSSSSSGNRSGGDVYDDHGNSRDSSTHLDIGDSTSGEIDPRGDEDYFTVDATEGDVIIFDINAREIGSELDSVIELYNEDGRRVGYNDDSDGSLDSYLEYRVRSDGEYSLKVRAFGRRGGPGYFYDLVTSSR